MLVERENFFLSIYIPYNVVCMKHYLVLAGNLDLHPDLCWCVHKSF